MPENEESISEFWGRLESKNRKFWVVRAFWTEEGKIWRPGNGILPRLHGKQKWNMGVLQDQTPPECDGEQESPRAILKKSLQFQSLSSIIENFLKNCWRKTYFSSHVKFAWSTATDAGTEKKKEPSYRLQKDSKKGVISISNRNRSWNRSSC